jgi:putative phosphoribosyl transferase
VSEPRFSATEVAVQQARIPIGEATVIGDLRIPSFPRGLVIFAHGSGSSRFSRRNRDVAEFLNGHHCATLLLDLLTAEEEAVDARTMQFRFDIPRLAARVVAAVEWAHVFGETQHLPIGLFGASTGAAAALIAAAERPLMISAVVSRGGRPDLAGAVLLHVEAPTLLIVGGDDRPVIEMNREAMQRMRGRVRLEIIAGATHLFEEPGTLAQVESLAASWFEEHLVSPH